MTSGLATSIARGVEFERMSTIRKLTDKTKIAIVALKSENGNDVCADCGKQGDLCHVD